MSHEEEQVPYALAVTLEVGEGADIPIYEEVRTRIRPRVPVVAAVGEPGPDLSAKLQTSDPDEYRRVAFPEDD